MKWSNISLMRRREAKWYRLALVLTCAVAIAHVSGCGGSNCEDSRTCGPGASSGGGGAGGSTGSGGSAATDGGGGDADASTSSFSVGLASSSLSVVEGQSVQLGVTITQTGTPQEVTLELVNAPTGVTAAPVKVPVGSSSAVLSIDAAAGATQGNANVSVRGTAGSEQHEVALDLLVMGPAGSLDQSFGTNGIAMIPWGVEVPPIGPVLAADQSMTFLGGYSSVKKPLELRRIKSDGSVDATFGTVLFPAPFDDNIRIPTALAGDGNGKLLVTDVPLVPGNPKISLVRFGADGTLDSSFGTNGEIGGATDTLDGSLEAVALDSAGNILVAGMSPGATPAGFVARVSNDQIDQTFNGTGDLPIDTSGSYVGKTMLVPRSDGGAYVVFGLGSAIPDHGLMASFLADGSLDTSTSKGTGIDTTPVGVRTAILSSGLLMLGGTDQSAGVVDAIYADLTKESSFGSLGRVTIGDSIDALAVDAAGDLLAAGTASGGWTLTRMSWQGVFDAGFGSDGTASFTDPLTPIGIAVLSDRRIVVAFASPASGGGYDLAIARVWP